MVHSIIIPMLLGFCLFLFGMKIMELTGINPLAFASII